jgi:hypothetical protein
LRLVAAILCLLPAIPLFSEPVPQVTIQIQESGLPDAPSWTLLASAAPTSSETPEAVASSSSFASSDPFEYSFYPAGFKPQVAGQDEAQAAKDSDRPRTQPVATGDLDADGNPIPLDRQQPKRILGFMPNFRSVSGGAKPHPPGWKYNFTVATRQSLDYSSFVFLGITSLSAEGINSHPVFGKGVGGFWAYTWRGFLDKTDGTYLGAWLLPSLLHQDTRYYAMGNSHTVPVRVLYIISRQVVTRTYSGHDTFNLAGLGGKVLTQVISRTYYPPGATDFSVLATKFGYSVMRDVAFTSIREFYPDIAAHYIRKHREKVAAMAARDAAEALGQ